jgi:hypothetical protein
MEKCVFFILGQILEKFDDLIGRSTLIRDIFHTPRHIDCPSVINRTFGGKLPSPGNDFIEGSIRLNLGPLSILVILRLVRREVPVARFRILDTMRISTQKNSRAQKSRTKREVDGLL